MDSQQDQDIPEPRLSIGALAQAADIPVATLRTWERRYGFPVPSRKPSGHRVYPLSTVARLRRIAQALARGCRAAEVVRASDLELDAFLLAIPAAAMIVAAPPPVDATESLHAIRQFDASALTRILTTEWARLGPVEFLEHRVAPLLREVGEAWSQGRLEVAHEHFFSECLGDLLRTLRLPIAERNDGPLVMLATLPGEQHAMGLQMAALMLSVAGCRVCNLGADLPLDQTAAQAKRSHARAVAVSVSLAHAGRQSAAHIIRLRTLLPRNIQLVVGGEGAPSGQAGVTVISNIEELDLWGRKLALASR